VDRLLPELDGVEATRRIMGEGDVAIVAFTGDAGDLLDRAVEAGAVGHVTKPFVEVELVKTVRDVLATRAREADRNAHHDRIRVMIEAMLGANRTEKEIVAAVHSMTGDPQPVEGLSAAIRLGARRLASLLRR
jgi:FixJ family two-component response regulator